MSAGAVVGSREVGYRVMQPRLAQQEDDGGWINRVPGQITPAGGCDRPPREVHELVNELLAECDGLQRATAGLVESLDQVLMPMADTSGAVRPQPERGVGTALGQRIAQATGMVATIREALVIVRDRLGV